MSSSSLTRSRLFLNGTGGVWRDDGRWFLLPRADDGGGVSLRDTEPLGEGRQGTGGGIAEGAQRA
jgi:hypothetical protein